MGVGSGEQMELNSQVKAKRRKDRVEREEFIMKFRVCLIIYNIEQNLHVMQVIGTVNTFPQTIARHFNT